MMKYLVLAFGLTLLAITPAAADDWVEVACDDEFVLTNASGTRLTTFVVRNANCDPFIDKEADFDDGPPQIEVVNTTFNLTLGRMGDSGAVGVVVPARNTIVVRSITGIGGSFEVMIK